MKLFFAKSPDTKMLCSFYSRIDDESTRRLSICPKIDEIEILEQKADFHDLRYMQIRIRIQSSLTTCLAIGTCSLAILARKVSFFRALVQNLGNQAKEIKLNPIAQLKQLFSFAFKYILPPVIQRLVSKVISSIFGDENQQAPKLSQQSPTNQSAPEQTNSSSLQPNTRLPTRGSQRDLSYSQQLRLRKVERLTHKIELLKKEIEYLSNNSSEFNYNVEWLELHMSIGRSGDEITDCQRNQLCETAKVCIKMFKIHLFDIISEKST